MKKLKFKLEDLLSINGNTGTHKFEDGELVTVIEVNNAPEDAVYPHYKVTNSNGTWCVDEYDLDLYKSA